MKRSIIMAVVSALGALVCLSLLGCEKGDYAYVGGPGREGFTASSQGPRISAPPPDEGEGTTETLPWEVDEQPIDPYNPYNGYNRWWYWW